MINIATSLEHSTALHPDKCAIHFADRELSYAQLNAAANQVANGLKVLGIGRGDTIVLSCPNIPYFPIVYYGILKAGAVVVPINVLLKASEIAYHLQDAEAKAYFCFEGTPDLPLGTEGYAGFQQAASCSNFFLITTDPTKPVPVEGMNTLARLMKDQPTAAMCANTDANDTAVILYTSGTTGRPKGAELTHANIAMNAMACHALMRQSANDVHLIVLPMFHSFGQITQMHAGLMAGASLVLLARFELNAVFRALQKHRVTIFAGVPTMFVGLLNHPGVGSQEVASIATHLRLGLSGGAAMPVAVMKQFEERFQIAILEGYGLSETSPVATFSFLEYERIPGCVGKPIWGTEVRVVDAQGKPVVVGTEGEIVIRGHNVMKGYYKRPHDTAEAIRDGWFHSGDIGRMDEQGNLFIVDRLKDMIIRGGFNVYPRELEEVLMTHDAIAQAAVIGVPHDTHGEEIKAFVTLKPGRLLAPQDLVAWSKEHMASYKYPRSIEIVQALPMTATGKILKRALRAL